MVQKLLIIYEGRKVCVQTSNKQHSTAPTDALRYTRKECRFFLTFYRNSTPCAVPSVLTAINSAFRSQFIYLFRASDCHSQQQLLPYGAATVMPTEYLLQVQYEMKC
jgi:hypothetical protein